MRSSRNPVRFSELLDEPRVGRQFEHPDAVRLQSMRVPNAMNRGRAQPLRGGHRPQTPVGGPRRLGAQRGVYDLLLASCGTLAVAPRGPGQRGSTRRAPQRRTGGATRAPYPGSCRAVERCTCSAGRQRRATRCGSATPRAAPWSRLEASVPASRGALASVAKRGLGSWRARYQSPIGSTRRLAITALASTETSVAANHRRAMQAFYAAEAVLEWVVQELRGVQD